MNTQIGTLSDTDREYLANEIRKNHITFAIAIVLGLAIIAVCFGIWQSHGFPIPSFASANTADKYEKYESVNMVSQADKSREANIAKNKAARDAWNSAQATAKR